MRKRGLSLLLTAAILTGTLTGCGNSGGGVMRQTLDRAYLRLR